MVIQSAHFEILYWGDNICFNDIFGTSINLLSCIIKKLYLFDNSSNCKCDSLFQSSKSATCSFTKQIY